MPDKQQRLLALDGTNNFRDLGGYRGDQGRSVKWHCLYRADALHKLSPADLKKLEELGLKSIVDFRSPNEILDNEDKIITTARYYNLNPKAEVAQMASASLKNDQHKISQLVALAESDQGAAYFKKHHDDMANQMRQLVSSPLAIEQYRQLMDLLLIPERVPLVFHCRGGKDRTGIAAMFILLALGVSEDEIYADYLLTRTYNEERNQRRMNEYRQLTANEAVLDYLYRLMDARPEYLKAAFDEMLLTAGSVKAYLSDVLQLTDDRLTDLRNRYLID